MKGCGLIGASVKCRDCDFTEDDIEGDDWYRKASEKAREHCRKTGHTVDVELVFYKRYEKVV